jgi:phosphatidylglycerol:prolipoprotein diacylglycerol transferase
MIAPDIDPVFFSIGPIEIRWYGLMYFIGFVVGSFILQKLRREGFLILPKEKIDSLLVWIILAIFIGARTGYVLIYNWDYYSSHPLEILFVWQGGLSFHGGLAGLIVMMYLFSRHEGLHIFHLSDSLAIVGSQGLGFGRLGNFINHELYGRVTDAPWGMVFRDAGPYCRHPSQLYESLFEGWVLFILLYALHGKAKYYGVVSSVFLLGYGTFRYVIEFFREPDPQVGFFLGGTTTMGQILCLMMIAAGALLFVYANKKKLPIQLTPTSELNSKNHVK